MNFIKVRVTSFILFNMPYAPSRVDLHWELGSLKKHNKKKKKKNSLIELFNIHADCFLYLP